MATCRRQRVGDEVDSGQPPTKQRRSARNGDDNGGRGLFVTPFTRGATTQAPKPERAQSASRAESTAQARSRSPAPSALQSIEVTARPDELTVLDDDDVPIVPTPAQAPTRTHARGNPARPNAPEVIDMEEYDNEIRLESLNERVRKDKAFIRLRKAYADIFSQQAPEIYPQVLAAKVQVVVPAVLATPTANAIVDRHKKLWLPILKLVEKEFHKDLIHADELFDTIEWDRPSRQLALDRVNKATLRDAQRQNRLIEADLALAARIIADLTGLHAKLKA